MESIISLGMVIVWALVGAIVYAVINTVEKEGK